jgi:hypothetical protein
MSIFGYAIINIKKLKAKFDSANASVQAAPIEAKTKLISAIETKISELIIAVETDEYSFPEFSSLSKEEAKSMSIKALSVVSRIVGLFGDKDDSED